MRNRIILLAFLLSAQSLVAQVESKVYRWNELTITKEPTRERRQVLKGPTRDLELLEIHASSLEPGMSPHASHTHDAEEELIIVKEGILRVTIRDRQQLLGPGSVAMAIPGEEHGFQNGGDRRVTYYIIKFRSKEPMNVDRAMKAGGSFMLPWDSIAENKTDRGSRRNFFERPTSMTARYEMHVTRLNKGLNSHAPHTHRAEEIVLIIEGNVEMRIGTRFENATAGDLVFLGSEVPHALTNKGDGPCMYFAFQW